MKKILTILLLLLASVTLVGCGTPEVANDEDNIIFTIFGDEDTFITVGNNYNDIGYIAKDSGVDLSEYVEVVNPVDADTPGVYEITYTLNYHGNETIIYRYVYVQYVNSNCAVIEDTNTVECYKNWSSYLHTTVTLKITFDKRTIIDSAEVYGEIESIMSLYHQISDKYDNYDGFVNVKTINDDPTAVHTILPELYDLIEFTLEHQDDVHNLFNIALGPVLQIWHNFREDCTLNQLCQVPPMQDLLDADAFTDPNDIILDSANSTITMGANMSLDLGGVSKGYISGIIIDYLDTLAIEGYLLNNGTSNISTGGTHPTREGGHYILAVTDPSGVLPYYATVNMTEGDQLVTSGDYQQYYKVGDAVYHHIIHNDTLMPERNSRSVSIIFDEPGLADLYSTAIFLMTIEEGLEFVNSNDNLEAIWYTMDDEVVYSSNFQDKYLNEAFIPIDEDFINLVPEPQSPNFATYTVIFSVVIVAAVGFILLKRRNT